MQGWTISWSLQGLYGSWKTWKVLEFYWHFPGEENPGKRLLVLESSGNLLNSSTKIWNVWQTVLRINIEISGVKWSTWNLVLENQSESWKSSERVPVRDFFSGKGAFFSIYQLFCSNYSPMSVYTSEASIYNTANINNGETRHSNSLNYLVCWSSKLFNHGLNHNLEIHTARQFCDFQYFPLVFGNRVRLNL